MKCHWLRDQRGSALVFTTLLLGFLIAMGGLAIDLTYLGAAKGELQRSMDAAALAGAGNLGFDDTVFPTVRQEAWRFGNLNPYRVGTVNLSQNAANAANGDIVLGIWDSNAGTFSPSLDGTLVNAVMAQYATQIPTSFLRLLGVNTLQVSADAIAVSDPPALPPNDACVAPIGLTDCPFSGSSSGGCGEPITFISSSGKQPILDTSGTNTAGWVNLEGTDTPNVPLTKDALQAAADGETCSGTDLQVKDEIGTNNGMQQTVFDLLEDLFFDKYTASPPDLVVEGEPGYEGKGWEIWVPVLGFEAGGNCPPQAINGVQEIVGWTRMVMTQIINHGECAVSNNLDPNSWPMCPPPMNPSGQPKDPNLRAAFGYYECQIYDAPGIREPAPRSALATRLRLVR